MRCARSESRREEAIPCRDQRAVGAGDERAELEAEDEAGCGERLWPRLPPSPPPLPFTAAYPGVGIAGIYARVCICLCSRCGRRAFSQEASSS